jgi:RING finger and CHY zinc finger domain-containing protein 1
MVFVSFLFVALLCNGQAKKPFHCDLCGFCRVGGVESFRHCEQCCMCISVSVFETHQCFKDKYKNNCPVCREDMFSSRQSPQDLPCGHAIHAHCFRKLAGFDYRCPICKKTVVSQSSMAAAWDARARDIADHAMPPDLQRIVDIMCNDCEVKSHNRQWHFLGIQCPSCNSFNTVVENVVSTAADLANGNANNNVNNNNNNDTDSSNNNNNNQIPPTT